MLSDYVFDVERYDGQNVVSLVKKEFWEKRHCMDDTNPYHEDGTLDCIKARVGLVLLELMDACLEVTGLDGNPVSRDVIIEKLIAAGLTHDPSIGALSSLDDEDEDDITSVKPIDTQVVEEAFKPVQKKPKNIKYWRTIIEVEILTQGIKPPKDDELNVGNIDSESFGSWSNSVLVQSKDEVEPKEMAELLKKQNNDPTILGWFEDEALISEDE